MKYKNNILNLFEERGITIEQFAADNHVSYAAIKAFCDGTCKLRNNDIKHFAEILNVTPAEIIGTNVESVAIAEEDVTMLNALSAEDRVIVHD